MSAYEIIKQAMTDLHTARNEYLERPELMKAAINMVLTELGNALEEVK